ncbi:MAG: hypothetical protein EZS28_052541 [Streblomastix strix]|uniref:Uncharacterized protein n=1 Tax=Streblomastix strix TaxID=222440 RepID=A0A5J4S3N2_9EUKA|nr:MAG: hypothetical protein EZS28_052541 [Streblomastix strix]
MQINPTATGYDDGLRISRSDPISTGNSLIHLGCSRTSYAGAIEEQWSIFTSPNSSTYNPYSFVIAELTQAGDNTKELQISTNGNILTFNGNGLVEVGTDQTISGIKTFGKLLQVNPTLNGTFNEGIRISRQPDNK